MPPQQTEIVESAEEIEQYEELFRGEPQELRLRALSVWRENPTHSNASVAAAIGCSERSVQRWKEAYADGGINGLLETRRAGGARPRRLGRDAMDRFRRRVETQGFRNVAEAQAWLSSEFNVAYSRTAVWKLLRDVGNASHGLWSVQTQKSFPHEQVQSAGTGSPLSDRITAFLNSFPSTMDGVQWINAFREGLVNLFEDVDRVSIIVNTLCDLLAPEEYVPTDRIVHHRRGASHAAISVGPLETTEEPRWATILEDFRHQGYPLNDYHAPNGFDYYYQGEAYLGTVFLWRGINRPPISTETIAVMESLKPFLTFMLSDMVTRHQYQKPVDRVFYQAFERLVDESSLSPQERRIIALQLLGHSYKEMADALSVSVDTVKKHFKQIHKKTGTRAQAELFAKFFSARLGSLDSEKEKKQPS